MYSTKVASSFEVLFDETFNDGVEVDGTTIKGRDEVRELVLASRGVRMDADVETSVSSMELYMSFDIIK